MHLYTVHGTQYTVHSAQGTGHRAQGTGHYFKMLTRLLGKSLLKVASFVKKNYIKPAHLSAGLALFSMENECTVGWVNFNFFYNYGSSVI